MRLMVRLEPVREYRTWLLTHCGVASTTQITTKELTQVQKAEANMEVFFLDGIFALIFPPPHPSSEDLVPFNPVHHEGDSSPALSEREAVLANFKQTAGAIKM